MAKKNIITLLIVVMFFGHFSLYAQQKENTDSLVTLLSAQYAKLFEENDVQYRQIKGPAVFLHNGAYMFCDSAIWNLETDIIDAFDNVRLVQDKTILSSDHLTYTVEKDLAEFKGNIVELYDEEGNVFRSNNLSYNTKDSIAVSYRGGTMRDKDGNVIEGDTGTYDVKASTFTFSGNTQVFMDTLFMRSTVIRYNSDENRVHFGRETRIWYDEYFMTADDGWYDRETETIFFRMNVYMNDPSYEGWCDELYYYRPTATFDMFSNVQVLDTLHQMVLVSNSAHMVIDTLTNDVDVTLTQDPVLIYYGEDKENKVDSLFLSADTLRYYTKQAWQVNQTEFIKGDSLRNSILFDAIQEAERAATEAYEKNRQKAYEKTPEYQALQKRRSLAAQNTKDSLLSLNLPVPDSIYVILGETPPAPIEVESEKEEGIIISDTISNIVHISNIEINQQQPDEEWVTSDTLSVNRLSMQQDETLQVEEEKDTTSLAFINAYYNVRAYRDDLQARCDSLYYSDVDSVARMNGRPILWENIKNQLTADLMMFVINEDGLYRGNMQNNAMIVSQEDEEHFNQIKSLEMVGHFVDNEISRFDALGGVNALIYLREDSVLTTMNSKESRFMTATMKDGDAQRFKYYENTKSDAYPVADLDIEKQRLKDFQWRADERPVSRQTIISKQLRTSDRLTYSFLLKPKFPHTDKYFDKYMSGVYEEIKINEFRRDSIARVEADYKALLESIDNFICEVVIPYLQDEESKVIDSIFKSTTEEVRLWGIEPQPEEPESSILSIKLQAHKQVSQKYDFSHFFINLDKLNLLKDEGIHFSGSRLAVLRNGERFIRFQSACKRII